MTSILTTTAGDLAYDDRGGTGRLLLMLPGAGDVRSEHRFLADQLAAGNRVVTMDLRGHGESGAGWDSYGVAETSDDITALIRHLDVGPAVVVANSFAPAAALWAAATNPELVAGVVAISPHLDQDAGAAQRLALSVMLRGPWAGTLWDKLYRGWYKSSPPADLDEQVALLRTMMRNADRRAAVRHTLVANRIGLDDKLAALSIPVLSIFGGADDHFDDPAAAAADAAERTGGSFQIVPATGHYPHVERPDLVTPMIESFLETV